MFGHLINLTQLATFIICHKRFDAAWGSWRLHILDVRMGHDRKPNYEAVPR